ncbi:MAG: hypothetical protein HDR11_03835 [Lachnospiraceae bacterium]|nr:hypothetical protein [Lachnospiraceae bacterium]
MKKRGYIIFFCIFLFCGFFSYSGMKLEHDGNIIWNGIFIGKLLLVGIITGLVGGFGVTHIFLAMDKRKEKAGQSSEKPACRRGLVFGASLGMTLLAWLPVFLAFYPGNCTYDIGGQTWYIVAHHYEEHHPLAHTLLMEFFINIGKWAGDVNFGMALYILFQMVCIAGAFAFAITELYTLGVNRKWIVVLQLWSMFFIPNWYLSVSTTKDVIFTAAVLVMLFCLYKIVLNRRNTFKIDGWDIGFVVAGILMVLFRNNGKYALAVTFVIVIAAVVWGRKSRKLYMRIAGCSLCILLVGSMLLSMLAALTNATKIRKEEMLSVPVQQISRLMEYQEDIADEDRAVIDSFILDKAYENYIPSISDPVKSSVDLTYLRYHILEFAGTYFRLFLQYPGDFINAVLALDAGYLNPFDATHKDVYSWGASWLRVGWSPNEDLGLSQEPKMEKWYQALYDFADKNQYDKIPVLGYFVMPGGYLWFYLLFAGWLLWKKRYSFLLVLSYMAGYYVTLFLGPTVQLRYMYPVMAALPFLLAGMTGAFCREPLHEETEEDIKSL